MNIAPSSAEKIAVLKGISFSWILALAFIAFGYKGLRHAKIADSWSTPQALGFALACAAWTLIFGIGWAARTRYFSSNIDGTAPDEGSALDITLRYIRNTSEQALIFALAATAFAAASPIVATTLLPVMGVWFIIARGLFWIGYRSSPLRRATGFAATFHPTIALLLAATYKLIAG